MRDALLKSGLFDAGWYAAHHPDVALTGMDPLNHFLSVGLPLGRDPGPGFSELFFRHSVPGLENTGRTALRQRLGEKPPIVHPPLVMKAAALLADAGRCEDAIRLAGPHLPNQARPGLQLLRANDALARGNRASWLSHLNTYLEPFDIAPLLLRGGLHLLQMLSTAPTPRISGGPKISVIMPAFNAEATVEAAARSILDQTWGNLELLIVDDASTDGTWPALQRLAATDPRVRIRRNPRNLGPYVSKNIALDEACGDWITGHDADDWAHPQRIENHLGTFLKGQGRIKAGTIRMLRACPTGRFDDVIALSPHHSPDGIRRRAFISCLFEREVLNTQLGYWDSIRFGADAEMIERTQAVLGEAYRDIDQLGMICLNMPTGLTNHPVNGLRTVHGIADSRRTYQRAYRAWHAAAKPGMRLGFPLHDRPFPAPVGMAVSLDDVLACLPQGDPAG